MGYVYKQLASSDIAHFKSLLRMFGEAFDDIATYQADMPSDAYIRSLLDKPHFIALVALDGSDVVGGLTAYVLEKFERERAEIYIYDLAVAAEHRRRGVASQLIGALKALAKRKGAYVIFVQADIGDEAAIALYESLGTREDVHHFDIPVD
jgi:aminoglycoside 3-N-acetyltransferase I